MPKTLQATLSHLLPQSVRQFVLCTTYGSRRNNSSRWIHDNSTKPCNQLGKAFERLADAICHSMLWNRIDGNCVKQVRFSQIRSRSVSVQPEAGGLDDRGGAGLNENDARLTAYLSSNDRTQVGYIDGCLRLYRWFIRHLRSCTRNRSVSSCRCLCTWLSTKARDANRGSDGNSANYRRRQYSVRWRWQPQAASPRFGCAQFASRCNNQRFITQQNSLLYVTNIIGCIK